MEAKGGGIIAGTFPKPPLGWEGKCPCPTEVVTPLTIATPAVPCVNRRPMCHPLYMCELVF